MGYFDFLRQGSEVHKVGVRSEKVFTIRPTNENEDCWLKFQTIVTDAKAHAHREYIVLPKRNFMRNLRGWSGPVYDFDVITRTD
jgi:hypothetical protein